MSTRRSVALEAAAAAAISLALALVVIGPVLPLLNSSWFTADMLAQYVTTDAWSIVSFAPTTHYGFPLGLDYNFFPNGDGLENALTHGLNMVAGAPFGGVNLFVLLSYPLAGALALILVRLTRLSGPLAVAFAVAIAMLPFHWIRSLPHAYISTTVSMLCGLILVLLVASGRLMPLLSRSRGRRRAAVVGGLVVLVMICAWSGVYYAAFTIILGLAALVLRFAKGDRARALALASLPLAAIAVLAALGQALLVVTRGGDVVLQPNAERLPIESFTYAGSLVSALIPGPLSIFTGYSEWLTSVFADAPELENLSAGNFGTVVTSAALAIFLVTLLMRSRRGQAVSPPDPSGITPGVIAWLIGATLVFFIPWGLNFAFAVLVTPQIRSWNRLLPALLVLFILGAATVLRDASWVRSPRASFYAACLVVLLVVFDVVVPTAASFVATVRIYTDTTERARVYASDVNAAIPGDCGILQLPINTFPEPDVVFGKQTGYEPLWQSLTNPEKRWSYGAIKGTSASAWQDRIDGAPTNEQIDVMQLAGFCGIHLDRTSVAPAEATAIQRDLTERLGDPVAIEETEGWLTWRLPAPSPVTPPSQWPSDVREFFGVAG